MKRYKRVLVCIDNPEHDARMLEYAGGRTQLAESEDVFFLHVVDELPPSIEPEPVMTEQDLADLVSHNFKGHGQERIHCRVVVGSRLVDTLRMAHDEDADLIMMSRRFGRKGPADHQALLARRITSKATCSVLVLPEEYAQQADEIIVPVRDSECSANALEVATGIAEHTGAAVTALNIFHVGGGYSRVGTSLEKHEALLAASAEKEVARLVKRADTHGVEVASKCVPDLRGNPVPVILRELGDGKGKAVVIGARGRSGAAGVLLGTVTEQLIREAPSPVMAVKKKGECLGVLKALLTLASE